MVLVGYPVKAASDNSAAGVGLDQDGMPAYPDLPANIDLDQAVEMFRQRGYDLLIADASVQNAQGNLASAGQIANPTINFGAGTAFGYSSKDLAGASPIYYGAGINDNGALLDLLFVHKRQLRIEVAQAALDSQRYSRTDVERGLVAMVKQQWVAVAAAKKQLDINRDLLKSNEETERLIVARFNAGAASQVDVAMQKTATFEAAQQVAYAQAAYAQARVLLAFLLGHRGGPPTFEVDAGFLEHEPAAAVATATPQSLRQIAENNRPDVLAQMLQVERAEASIRLTHRMLVPDFQLGANYVQQGVGQNAISPPTATLSLTVTPPLFYQLQGELTMAQADLRTQQVALAKSLAQVVNDIDTGFAAYQSASERLYRMNHGYLEQSKLQYDLTKIQYDKGAASLVDLLVAQRAYVTTVAEWVQALNDYWSAIFSIEAAVAKEFK